MSTINNTTATPESFDILVVPDIIDATAMMSTNNATLAQKIAPPASVTLTETGNPQQDWSVVSPGQKILIDVRWGLMDDTVEHRKADAELTKDTRVCVRWRVGHKESKWNVIEGEEVDKEDEEKFTVNDPNTPAGQKVGAILVVKRASNSHSAYLEVGNFVKILRLEGKPPFKSARGLFSRSLVVVERLNREGSSAQVPWNTFLPVGPREICECPNQACRCEYENYEMSKKFHDTGMFNP